MQALLDYKTAEQDANGKPYFSAKLVQEFDCDGERGRTRFFSCHAGHMGAGQVVYREMRADSEWRTGTPRAYRRNVVEDCVQKIKNQG